MSRICYSTAPGMCIPQQLISVVIGDREGYRTVPFFFFFALFEKIPFNLRPYMLPFVALNIQFSTSIWVITGKADTKILL